MIELQRKLLGDKTRNDAFERALRQAIKPGMTVVDLGSGTGFLSFLASRLGAKECIGYEVGEIAETSKKLAVRNKIKNCRFIRMHSTQERKPIKADIVISETLGNYALEENMIETMEDGKRFLKTGGVLIPGKVTQLVAPVTSQKLAKEVDIWNDVGFDMTFDEARTIGLNNMYVKTVKPEDLLQTEDAIRAWDHIDFTKKNKSIRETEQVWKAEKPTEIYGLALWWDAELIKGVHLATGPSDPPTHWEQIYLPLLQPVSLKAGESLELGLRSDTRWEIKVNLEWKVTHLDASGKKVSKQELDMMNGYLA